MVETPRVLLPIGCVGSNTRSYHTKKIDYGRFSSYSDQQRTLGRPLSPHLTIYKQPITAISSISNRISGIALGTGIAAASTLAIVATNGDIRPYIFRAQDSVPYFAPVAKFLVALPLTYHWLAGARQMIWDHAPDLINLKAAPNSSRALFGLTGAVSVGAALFTIERAEE